MSFVAELKQRKVFRVATVYLVVAWVAIQAASIALPAFDAPVWTLRFVILLFALGFPLVLLLTWALQLTPEGITVATSKAGNKRMAGIVAGLTALAIGWYFVGQPALRNQAIAGERSIAVLPFVNMSGDKENEYFSDGLAETTLDMLAQVKDLKVIARTSSFAFKGKAADVREIGKTLDAAHLLEGSVQQAGDTVRITVQLIRTSDGVHLWSQRYDRKLADVFEIQDEIATEVVKALQLALPAAEQKHLVRKRTDNVAAYQEYLKGNALLPGRKVSEMRIAARHFERAIELDPGYARAYAAAATAYGLLKTHSTISATEHARRTAYVERALELAPDLGEAHVAHGALLQDAIDLQGAERGYRRGITLAPGYATAYQWLGELLMYDLGKTDDALVQFDRALALDPISPIIRNEHAFALAAAGRIDEGLAANQALIAEHPDFAIGYRMRAEVLENQGDLVGALRAWNEYARLDPDATRDDWSRCRALAIFGDVAYARACATEAAVGTSESRTALENRARLAALSGDFAEALALHDRIPNANPWNRAHLLVANGRADEAVSLLRKLEPEVFVQPAPAIVSPWAFDSVLAGSALLMSGATEQGRQLLRQSVRVYAGRPRNALVYGIEWWDVYAHALLGDFDQACAALKQGVDDGYYLNLPELDVHPLLASLREQPCFQQNLAPARAQAAAQVAAARAAGLL